MALASTLSRDGSSERKTVSGAALDKRDETAADEAMQILPSVLVLASCACLLSASPDVLLDQSVHVDPDQPIGTKPISAGFEVAQTFEVGLAGTLWQLRMPLGFSQPPSAPLRLDVRGVSSQGAPDERVFDSWALPPASFGTSVISSTFGLTIPVEVGDKFSIVLSSEAEDPASLAHYETFTVDSSYDRGTLFARTAGGSWQEETGSDLIFASYVLVPEPGVLSLVGLGVAALAWSRRRSLFN